MTLLRAGLLGILQPLTEFFPFSHAAHILLLQKIFNLHGTYGAYDIVIDAGTVLAIFVYYFRDVKQMLKEAPFLLGYPFSKNKSGFFWDRPYALTFSLIGISSAATAVVRFILIDAGNSAGALSAGLSLAWIFSGGLIYRTKKFNPGVRGAYEMNQRDAFLIGMAQGFAVFPGISRLGVTVVTALALGVERKEAARYSFLLGIPYLLAALIFKLLEDAQFHQSDQAALLVSFAAALFSGIAVLMGAVPIIGKGKFHFFSYYCFLIGLFSIFYSLFPGIEF